MTIRDKYVNGMNKIIMKDELKQLIIKNVERNSPVSQPLAVINHCKVVMVSISLITIFLFIGVAFFIQMGSQNTSSPFGGFVVTAYAADGTSSEVKPNVEFPLGKYSLFMSNVPGFPIKIVAKDADEIKVLTIKGQILLWNSNDGQINLKGKTATINSGELFYWTPLIAGEQSKLEKNTLVNVTAYKNNKKLGSSKIEIKLDENNIYKGILIIE
ncbi:hypothetical protein J2Z69_003319 [Paenibacillus shirakamiensis]|uniref:DUF4179 domain-containing protein n=1 Tax=Paenibacillus shirakamiensis TaxID=1265935 RepID=A0ABS4JKL8_9BACL|nr:hypothetical protein [Paenibacillus shirakamiensis]MBP2002247.1 hypothetical protein [Paenibacillus shirakamiensis]